MKNWCLLVLLAAASLPVAAQKHTVQQKKKYSSTTKVEKTPETVVRAFHDKFSSVTKEKWHEMASGHWYADFQNDSTPAKAEFTPEGQWVATREALDSSQLPETIVSAIQQKFPGATFNNITHIERSDVAPYYEISLQVNGAEKDILANNSGAITE